MALPQPSENRWFPRYHTVNREFRISFLAADGAVNARLLDVSRDGLGVLVDREVSKNAALAFELEGKHIKMSVVYCQKDLIHVGWFRVGLRRQGSQENLVGLFVLQKCIDP